MNTISKKFATPFLLVFSLLAGSEEARAQLRADYRNPVAGEQLKILVSGAAPYAVVQIVAVDDAGNVLSQIARQRADGSGSLTHALALPDALAGERMNFLVNEERAGATPTRIALRVVAPSLLLTGTAAGEAVHYRLPIAIDRENPFDLASARAIRLGSGRPGGAVRDGRSTRTFVISDRDRGTLAILSDGDDSRLDITLAPDLRDIVVTPDGRTVLVAAAGATGANARIFLIPTDDSTQVRSIDLGYPFGTMGGRRIAVSDDGLRAFVTLDGSLLREVDLLALQTSSKLLSVGAPGLDEIRDLRVVGDRLVALTQKAGAKSRDSIESAERTSSAVTNVDLADPRHAVIARTNSRDAALDLAAIEGNLALFVVDGGVGEVRVLDVVTLESRGAYTVPPGADALLLTPDPQDARAALLYGARTPTTSLRLFDLATGRIAPETQLGFSADAFPVSGSSLRIDLFFLIDSAGRLVAIRPDATQAISLSLPVDLIAASIGD